MLSMDREMKAKTRRLTSRDSSTVVFDGLATGDAEARPASSKAAKTRDATEYFITEGIVWYFS